MTEASCPVLVIHGGAGTIAPARLTPDLADAYHTGLAAALAAGHAVLAAGGPACDAVVAAVLALEDDPLFNAGRGAVYTAAKTFEMDAALMNGADRRAGAVAGVCGPRNPILAARAVLERGEQVLLAGEGAMAFCREAGIDFADPEWFATERRLEALRGELARRAAGAADTRDDADRHGTVGAVALDRAGNLAAATSTGGLTAKRPGRIGDTPVFGAGTWADDRCAVSCTGQGEVFIRFAAAHEIAARVRWGCHALADAAEDVIARLAPEGGSGGLIALGADGAVALPFNCDGMYRGVARGGVARTAIHREAMRESSV